MTRSRCLLFVLFAAVSPFLIAQTSNTCFSISQNLLQNPDNAAWLTSEIPPNAKLVKVSYYARPLIPGQNPSWVLCANQGVCQGTSAYFPPVGTGSDTPPTGTQNWSAMVLPYAPYGWYDATWVRLVVEYTTTDAVCKTQQSFQSAANAHANGIIVLPVGKSPAHYYTYGAELVPGGVWQPCGDSVSPMDATKLLRPTDPANPTDPTKLIFSASVNIPENCTVPGGPIGGLAFYLTVDKDEADNAVRVSDLCEDRSGTLRRGCRTVVTYAP